MACGLPSFKHCKSDANNKSEPRLRREKGANPRMESHTVERRCAMSCHSDGAALQLVLMICEVMSMVSRWRRSMTLCTFQARTKTHFAFVIVARRASCIIHPRLDSHHSVYNSLPHSPPPTELRGLSPFIPPPSLPTRNPCRTHPTHA